jgi:hypothetical protein
MGFQPVVITADNFATPAMRTAMDEDSQVKIYLFIVQSLTRPTTRQARKTHKFHEGVGTEFYAHLQQSTPLVVFAESITRTPAQRSQRPSVILIRGSLSALLRHHTSRHRKTRSSFVTHLRPPLLTTGSSRLQSSSDTRTIEEARSQTG